MQTSTIKFSQIEDRIDAEYYKPEYLEITKILKNRPSLGKFIKIKNGYPFDSTLFGLGDFPVVRIRDFTEDGIHFDELETLPSYYVKESGCVFPKLGDILVGMDGLNEFRATIITSKKDTEVAINQRVAIITPFNKLSSEFIYIVLNSKVGQSQLLREMTTAGTVGHISNEVIKSIKVPIPPQSFQQKIEKMVKEAERKRKLADEKYKEAEEILNKELGLENLDLSTQKTFEAKFSEAEDRFDPEYYQPKYKKIISKLKSQKSKLLGEIVKIRKGIEVGHEAYTNKGKPFIRVQDYNEKGISVSGNTNFIRDYLYEELKENHRPLPGEIIYSKDGTVGRAFVVPRDNYEFIVSGGILILTPKDIDNYYLALVLNSPIIRLQAIRESIGAIIQHLSVDEVKKIKVPILPKPTQRKISLLIQESMKLRREAKELISKAKRKVEEMVEGR